MRTLPLVGNLAFLHDWSPQVVVMLIVAFLGTLLAFGWPVYLVGGLLCRLVWRRTEESSPFMRVFCRSLMLALTIAPGLAIGCGIAAVPAIYLLPAALLGKPGTKECEMASKFGLVPFVITWLIVVTVLWNRSSHDTETAV